MGDDLDFNADEFHRMSYDQRIRLCRKLAGRSRDVAKRASSNQREPYLRIAQEWDNLARELERLVTD